VTSRAGSSPPTAPTGDGFDYDPAGQLVRETGPGGERGFTYDAAGRLAAETGPDGERDYRYDAAGQLTSSTGPDGPRYYRYDAAGRRTAEEGAHDRRTYRWDPFGRLAGIDSTILEVDALSELARTGDVPLAWDTADPGAPPVYPNGYASYSNASGQTVHPYTGQTVSKSDPWWHMGFGS
jgi:YD repeat-containing protein